MTTAEAVASHEPLIAATARRFSRGDPDLQEDLEQEGRLTVLQTIPRNRPKAYVTRAILLAISRYAGKEHRERGHIRLDDFIPVNGENPERDALQNLAFEEAHLTETQAEALARAILGEEPLDQATRKAVQRARQKLRTVR